MRAPGSPLRWTTLTDTLPVNSGGSAKSTGATRLHGNLRRSAQLLVSDLASTLFFLAVLLVTRNVILAVAIGVGIGIAQIAWMAVRRKPIDAMQWLSIGLVVAAGVATLLTKDARFVMLKPTVIYCVVGAFMLRPGWMNRYLPPAAIQFVPDLAYAFGFVRAGLMS